MEKPYRLAICGHRPDIAPKSSTRAARPVRQTRWTEPSPLPEARIPSFEVRGRAVEGHDLARAVGRDESQHHPELDSGQPGRLDGDGLQHRGGRRLLRGELRDATQRGLRVRERLQVGACLAVGQRRGDEFGELLEPVLGSDGQRLSAGGGDQHPPHLGLDGDRRRDGRAEPVAIRERAVPFAGVVVDAHDASLAPHPFRQRLGLEADALSDLCGPAGGGDDDELALPS